MKIRIECDNNSEVAKVWLGRKEVSGEISFFDLNIEGGRTPNWCMGIKHRSRIISKFEQYIYKIRKFWK